MLYLPCHALGIHAHGLYCFSISSIGCGLWVNARDLFSVVNTPGLSCSSLLISAIFNAVQQGRLTILRRGLYKDDGRIDNHQAKRAILDRNDTQERLTRNRATHSELLQEGDTPLFAAPRLIEQGL